MVSPKDLFKKYLDLLEISRSEPNFDFLKRIVKAHLIKVPFENISKLIFKKQGMKYIPDLELFLEGIEKYNFGGTCYSNNYYLFLLLKEVGFEIKLCGADMKNPDVHLISIVTVEGNEYIVDGGYAAPFLNPLPRNLKEDYVVTLGYEKYIIKPKDEFGRTRVEQYFNGNLQHWYTAKPKARNIDDFNNVIEQSYSDDAVFMNAIRITKFTESGSMMLKNYSFTESVGNESKTRKITLGELPQTIQENFGMPLPVVKKAVGHFKELKDIYS